MGINIPKSEWSIVGYKEPLRELENGFGYYGVVTKSKDGEYIRSHCDGEFYTSINYHHVKRFGFKNTREYKEHFGLSGNTVLEGKSLRKMRNNNAELYVKLNTPEHLAKLREWAVKGCRSSKRGMRLSLERRNERGTCPDQLLEKIKKVADYLGYTPSQKDFKNFYGDKRYRESIYDTFGSWTNAVREAGLLPKKELMPNGYTDQELISRLRHYYERYGKVPLEREFGKESLPSSRSYRKHFKTLNNARNAAGIPEITQAYLATIKKEHYGTV